MKIGQISRLILEVNAELILLAYFLKYFWREGLLSLYGLLDISFFAGMHHVCNCGGELCLLLLPLEGSLFSNLIGLMVGRKKIKMATYTTAASDPVSQCIEQNKSF